MKREPSPTTFKTVTTVGLALPEVELASRYDGSPVLKARGCFMAGIATHPSAEPQSLVVRMTLADREGLLEDAPETYYVTEYYRPYPVVLARLSHLHRDAIGDLLRISWRLTLAKGRPRRATSARAPDPAAPAACARPPRSRRSR